MVQHQQHYILSSRSFTVNTQGGLNPPTPDKSSTVNTINSQSSYFQRLHVENIQMIGVYDESHEVRIKA